MWDCHHGWQRHDRCSALYTVHWLLSFLVNSTGAGRICSRVNVVIQIEVMWCVCVQTSSLPLDDVPEGLGEAEAAHIVLVVSHRHTPDDAHTQSYQCSGHRADSLPWLQDSCLGGKGTMVLVGSGEGHKRH